MNSPIQSPPLGDEKQTVEALIKKISDFETQVQTIDDEVKKLDADKMNKLNTIVSMLTEQKKICINIINATLQQNTELQKKLSAPSDSELKV